MTENKKEVVQEVRTQEQPYDRKWFSEKLGINLTQEQYDKIAILSCCVKDSSSIEITLRLLKVLNLI